MAKTTGGKATGGLELDLLTFEEMQEMFDMMRQHESRDLEWHANWCANRFSIRVTAAEMEDFFSMCLESDVFDS